jgi:hypothetical protein
MPNRFIFRQVYAGDLRTFLADGEIRAKNHIELQLCHQTSYQDIVDRRGTAEFVMPCGGVVNDYVPFYFSPLTSFTYTIHRGNVPLRSPGGADLGVAEDDERIFFVCSVEGMRDGGVECCFSDFPLNSQVPQPSIEQNLDRLEQHVHWGVFDDSPMVASIEELDYVGVCKYFKNYESPLHWQLRSQKRMAEFLVREALPLRYVSCIVAKSPQMRDNLQLKMDASEWNIPIYSNPGCYF